MSLNKVKQNVRVTRQMYELIYSDIYSGSKDAVKVKLGKRKRILSYILRKTYKLKVQDIETISLLEISRTQVRWNHKEPSRRSNVHLANRFGYLEDKPREFIVRERITYYSEIMNFYHRTLLFISIPFLIASMFKILSGQYVAMIGVFLWMHTLGMAVREVFGC